MRKEIRRKFLCFFTFCWMLLVFMPSVYATTTAAFTRKGSVNLYYGSSGSNNKWLTVDGKKMDAYCTARKWYVPTGTNVVYEIASGSNRYNKDNFIAGQIIKISLDEKVGDSKNYDFIQWALTCHFKKKAVVNYYTDSTSACSDSKIKEVIEKAKTKVSTYQFNEGSKKSKLPKITINPKSKVISDVSYSASSGYTYKSNTIKISGLKKVRYGGNGTNSSVPTYKLNLTSSASGSKVELCSGSKCYSNGATDLVDGDYTLKVSNAGDKGGKISLSITGENKSSYPSADIWTCKSNCGSKYGKNIQALTTRVSSVSVTRDISASQNFTYSAKDKYSALIEKVDESGNALKNATLKLYIADANGKELKELCRTNSNGNDTSCSVSELTTENNYKEGNQLCYEEITSPSGYKNIGSKCETIVLKGNEANTTKYYEYHKEGESWKETEITSNGEQIFKNYTTFAKGENVTTVGVFDVSGGKKVYTDAEKVYEYKYVVSDKEKTFYTTSDISSESIGDYNGNPIHKINIPSNMTDTSEKSGLETNLIEGVAYLKDGKYIVLSSTTGEDGVLVYAEKDPQESITKVKEYSSNTKVCYNKNTGVAADSNKYCSENYYMTQVTNANGSFHFTVLNTLNSIKISKRAINGTDELPGATLALYTTENGKCTNTLVSKNTSSALVFSYKVYTPVKQAEDDTSNDNSTAGGENSSGSTDTTENTDDGDIKVDDNYNYLDGLKWVSSDEPVTVSGLASGTYCLSETIPAAGYKKATTTTKFTVNDKGEIDKESIDGEYAEDKEGNKTLIIRNGLNKVTISKTDIVTSKELPGAKLRICDATKDNDGKYSAIVSTGETGDEVNDLSECDTPILADGSDASWESKDTPHEISGLPSGTYALVEITAPNGYEVAETIFFKMNDNGVLTDVDGNPLSDNKIVMHDKPINDVKTGDKYIITIIVITLSCLIIGVGMYYYSNKNKFNGNGKIRKRKIYLNKLN